MKLKAFEKEIFDSYINDLELSESVLQMIRYIQHGRITTYAHCKSVAYYSYWLCIHLHLKLDTRSVSRGALLHDFYLYDWHEPDISHRLHGFYHPEKALKNARKHFKLNLIEADIIAKHMWPLTITKLPKYRETFIVCMVDKLCSLAEILKIKIN